MTTLRAGSSTIIPLGLFLLCAGGWVPARAIAGDFQVTPTVTLSEEYNDNVDASAANRRTDYITHLQPGLALHYLSANSVWDAAYNPEYINFARGTQGDEINHRGLLKGSAELLGNFLYLDLSDNLSRVSLDVARDVTKDSVSANQVDQNLAKVSPYLLWRYSDKGSLKTGYSYTDVRYWNAGSSGGVDRRQQDASAELSHEILPKLSLTAQYTFSSVQSQGDGYDSHYVSTGVKYQYSEGGFVFGTIGNNWQFFTGGQQASNLSWDAGITQDFHVLVATLESKSSVDTGSQSVYGNAAPLPVPSSTVSPAGSNQVNPLAISTKVTTHSIKLDRHLERGAIGLSGSYSQYADTQAGGSDQTTIALGASGSYEIYPSLTASLNVTGDKVTGLTTTTDDFPYHFTGTGTLSYAFNYGLTAGLNYTHVMYRFHPDQSAGSVDVNRVALNLSKAF